MTAAVMSQEQNAVIERGLITYRVLYIAKYSNGLVRNKELSSFK
jgi:hypothetical protein